MHWEPPTQEEFLALIEAAQPDPLGTTHLENGLLWVTLSSFSPGPDGIAAYEAMFAELERLKETSQATRAIVLDLRGNKGGSSTWSRQIADRLCGKDAVAWALADYFRETEVWYLADEGNLAYFGSLSTTLRERGLPEIAEWADELHGSLRAANAESETFYKQPYGEELLAKSQPARPRSLPPVYVITDGGCVSACLDAVDTFTRFEGVKLVGAPTSADTEYLETRRERLPSGRGWVTLPTKIWVRRPRGSGEVYQPDLLVTDLDWTTETMVEHILSDLGDN
ncbi:MAG: S41 family peptidase [Pseudomonadota bacterium]